jgi:hypothetical protein
MLKTDQYYELDEEIISFFKKVELEFNFGLEFKYKFITNNKLKKLIELKKIPDSYAVLTNSEILVSVNDDFYYKVDDEIKTILFEQELDKIETNFEKGTFKFSQPSFKSSIGIVSKRSYDSVKRAIEVESHLVKHKSEEAEATA